MKWQKGQSGNPGGRKKLQWKEELEKAILAEGQIRNTTPYKRAAELYYDEKEACIGILNFYIAKLKNIEAKIDGNFLRLNINLPPLLQQEPTQIEEKLPGIPVESVCKDAEKIEQSPSKDGSAT
jgi:hypothetical protein